VHWAPGIPHALSFPGDGSRTISGASRREIADARPEFAPHSELVMPGLVPASTFWLRLGKKDVDGRDEGPGHDENWNRLSWLFEN